MPRAACHSEAPEGGGRPGRKRSARCMPGAGLAGRRGGRRAARGPAGGRGGRPAARGGQRSPPLAPSIFLRPEPARSEALGSGRRRGACARRRLREGFTWKRQDRRRPTFALDLRPPRPAPALALVLFEARSLSLRLWGFLWRFLAKGDQGQQLDFRTGFRGLNAQCVFKPRRELDTRLRRNGTGGRSPRVQRLGLQRRAHRIQPEVHEPQMFTTPPRTNSFSAAQMQQLTINERLSLSSVKICPRFSPVEFFPTEISITAIVCLVIIPEHVSCLFNWIISSLDVTKYVYHLFFWIVKHSWPSCVQMEGVKSE
ncbi:uncharacterized protein LOC119864363 [Canis lupus familiaris]|uniref:uncharacterized protein LOC119864363 n=1 Tax=Canis lupus familiaris TaxID=9615 RepID=UPI0003AE4930|nr:uncharacterized protein LOC119864363 [Canis lupus familiaris]XP_038310511.1 uncharacterized protein LOC119864363 [Canis lupus familiaris]XP_038420461.1 uncharacterized protein LOC119864363 [Canis lupus familiaris]